MPLDDLLKKGESRANAMLTPGLQVEAGALAARTSVGGNGSAVPGGASIP